jgi:predicted RNase H-like HicB family nuclease
MEAIMLREEPFSFRVVIRQEPDGWVAHCLELNLVTVAETVNEAESDIIDVIESHVRYALENDNLEYMYHPAPLSVWKDFFNCEDREKNSYRRDPIFKDDSSLIPIIEASKCFYRQICHA